MASLRATGSTSKLVILKGVQLKPMKPTRSATAYLNFSKDFQTVLQAVREEEVFVTMSERHHKTFNFTRHLLAKLSHHELQVNIKNNIGYIMACADNPSRPALPDSCTSSSTVDVSPQCMTCRTSGMSIPKPNVDVVLIRRWLNKRRYHLLSFFASWTLANISIIFYM